MSKLMKSASGLLRREDGNVTIEFVILLPVMLLLMGVAMDISIMYYKKSQIHEAIQDITRLRAIGAISKDGDAQTYLDALLARGFSDEAVASVSTDVSNPNVALLGPLVSTSVTVPLHDMQLLGFFSAIVGDTQVVIGDQQFYEAYSTAYYDPNGGWSPVDMTMTNGILQATDPLTTTITSTVDTTLPAY